MTDHPNPEQIELFAMDGLPADEHARVAEHTSRCAECAAAIAREARVELLQLQVAAAPARERAIPIRRWAPPAAVFALAALTLLWVLPARQGAPTLPAYTLEVAAEHALRATDAEPVLRPGVPFTAIARPTDATGAHPTAAAFLSDGGPPLPLEATVEVAPTGAIRLRATPGPMGGHERAATLVIVVGPAGVGLDDAARSGALPPGVQRLEAAVVLRPGP